MDEKQKKIAMWVGGIIGVLILYFALIKPALETGQIPIPGKEPEMISVTAYRCDKATRRCATVGKPLSILSGTEAVTHFTMTVTAGPVQLKAINSFSILSPPATNVDVGVTSRFYDALKNGQPTPTVTGIVPIGNSYVWDTKNGCTTDANCDQSANEQCYTVGVDKWCLMQASNYENSNQDVTFTAGIEGTYTTLQGTSRTVSNSGSKSLSITRDWTGADIYNIAVSEAKY